MISLSLYVASLSFLTSYLVARLMIRAGVGDVPVSRSSHTQVTPTGGGLGVLCGAAMGFLLLSFLGQGDIFSDLSVILSLCFAVAIIGLYDDLFSPPSLIKFGVFIGIIWLLIDYLGPVQQLPLGRDLLHLPYVVGGFGTLLWVFVVVNGVNFMDGVNGIMGGCMAIAFFGLCSAAHMLGAPQTFWLGLVSAAAWAGFLPLNLRRKALIFSGDIGALTAGFLFAAGVLLLAHETDISASIYLGAMMILPFLTDVLLTLLSRLIRQQNLLSPHRDHLYQRAVRNHVPYIKISWVYYGAFVICSGVALFMAKHDQAAISAAFLGMIILSIMTYFVGLRIWQVKPD